MCKHKNEELLPYYEKARDLLNYNIITGELTWRDSTKGRGHVHKKGDIVGSINGNGYYVTPVTLNKKSKTLQIHRIAWFIYYGYLPNNIDHINMDRKDNKISNLRDCTPQENMRNKRAYKNTSSKFKGVSFHKRDEKWTAQIRFNGKLRHLGYFNLEVDAHNAYERASKNLFGKFHNRTI